MRSESMPTKTSAPPTIPAKDDFSTPTTAPVIATLENETSIPSRIKLNPKNLF